MIGAGAEKDRNGGRPPLRGSSGMGGRSAAASGRDEAGQAEQGRGAGGGDGVVDGAGEGARRELGSGEGDGAGAGDVAKERDVGVGPGGLGRRRGQAGVADAATDGDGMEVD